MENGGRSSLQFQFPGCSGELKQLHDEHVHTMLSVWGMFDTKAQNFQELVSKHFDVPNAHVYDSTNPLARDFYWNNLVSPLFSQGWDAFWLDSAEPEEYWPHWGDAILRNKQIAIGNGAEYTNIYSGLLIRSESSSTGERRRTGSGSFF